MVLGIYYRGSTTVREGDGKGAIKLRYLFSELERREGCKLKAGKVSQWSGNQTLQTKEKFAPFPSSEGWGKGVINSRETVTVSGTWRKLETGVRKFIVRCGSKIKVVVQTMWLKSRPSANIFTSTEHVLKRPWYKREYIQVIVNREYKQGNLHCKSPTFRPRPNGWK